MAARHLDAVMAIEDASFPTPWSRKMFAEEIGRELSDALVACDAEDGRVCGYAVCWTVAGESHLLNIAVAPADRGRGVAKVIMRELFRRASRAGSELMLLEVRAGNEQAISLYRKLGFTFSGLRRGYYTDTGEDAVLMERVMEEGGCRFDE